MLDLEKTRAAQQDAWSRASAKFDEADQERVWQSFSADREGGVAMTRAMRPWRDEHVY